MAEPSNIRINPFTGTGGATNYVELTEKHIIPSVSPYVIRLNEVPEKQDPSNMKMVYVNESTGADTSTTLTEVAATPGKGEFRPDYSTNALDDKTWNTGLIEFSASDAGKIVQVTYTGTGMLAGVNSNHWPSWYTDRGDGSDGDFVPTGNTTISGVKNYTNVFIKSGITITIDKYARIKCQGYFINLGTIFGNGKGGVGGSGGLGSGGRSQLGSTTNGFRGNAAPYGAGGAGGAGNHPSSSYIAGAGGMTNYGLYYLNSTVIMNDDVIAYGAGGSGGGAYGFYNGDEVGMASGGTGGAGGAGLRVSAISFRNKGTISMNGTNGTGGSASGAGGGGGGNGGVVLVAALKVFDTGTISVSAGNGVNRGANGGSGFYKVKELGVM
nr:MAG TPA: hypothetical protein [Caudoviricetes sp.]